jgi:beta-glucosidase
LSYTIFEYSDIRLSSKEMDLDGEIKVAVTLTNKGKRKGAEVVQLYIRDLVASATRPVKELKGFQKIELEPGQSREVAFLLNSNDLAFYNAKGEWAAETGEFQVFVGTNSRDVKQAAFTLK